MGSPLSCKRSRLNLNFEFGSFQWSLFVFPAGRFYGVSFEL